MIVSTGADPAPLPVIRMRRLRSSVAGTAAASGALSLAILTEALADEVDALHRDIRAARAEPVRRAGFRCDTASGSMRQAGTELQGTAGHLGRMAAAMKPGACAVPWGVCPEHGSTLTSTGGKTWCRVIGCGRKWDYDRAGPLCIGPVRWTVTGKQGHACVMCDGHALDARKRLQGARAGLGEEFAVTGRLIRVTTAAAVATVAVVAAVISYRHACELAVTHGETGVTARLVPFTVDGLILAARMLILDANRRHRPVPPLARWCLGTGILPTIGANLAYGLSHGPIGALVSAWPALALAGSFELLMTFIRTESRASAASTPAAHVRQPVPIADSEAPPALTGAPGIERTVRAWHHVGHSQRAIARELNLDRRKVKRILDKATWSEPGG